MADKDSEGDDVVANWKNIDQDLFREKILYFLFEKEVEALKARDIDSLRSRAWLQTQLELPLHENILWDTMEKIIIPDQWASSPSKSPPSEQSEQQTKDEMLAIGKALEALETREIDNNKSKKLTRRQRRQRNHAARISEIQRLRKEYVELATQNPEMIKPWKEIKEKGLREWYEGHEMRREAREKVEYMSTLFYEMEKSGKAEGEEGLIKDMRGIGITV